MLRHKLSRPKVRLLLSILMLKDADRDHYAVLGVDRVVGHKPRHFADDGHKALIDQLRHLLGVGDALVAPHRNVHRALAYLLLPRGRGDQRAPPRVLYKAATLAG